MSNKTFEGKISNNIIKVIVVDDHKLIRTGVIQLLKTCDDIEVLGEASSGEDAVKLVREKRPDVILMDIKMPGIGGLEATRKIHHIDPSIKVLALTVLDSEIFPTRLLEEGAAGYITKDCGFDEIVNAIHVVYKGDRYISQAIAQKLALKRYAGADKTPFDTLSERELQVMIMITKGKKPQEIAALLHLSPKTINTYRYRLFEKLGVKSDVELTHLALQYGLIEND